MSCATVRKPDVSSVKPEAKPINQLVFLSFTISKISDSENSVVNLISKKKLNGKINDVNELKPANYTHYLAIDLLDDNDNLLSSTILEHPLFRQVEYTTDDNKQLLTKSLSSKEDSFFVRIQVKSNFSKISISESLNKSKLKRIGLIDF